MTKVANFFKSKIKSGYQNGLGAVRQTLAPLVYDNDAITRTKLNAEKAIIFPAIGIGAIAGIAFISKAFPKREALGIADLFFNKHKLETFSIFAFSGVGLAVGAKISSVADKIISGESKNKKDISPASIKGVVEKIDKYLLKHNPELFEKTETLVKAKVDKSKKAFDDKINNRYR
ncbi:MAG: hypothetical protein BWY78_00936 [Alphaproteobacteria bacterium ADurb.Bin438]|nr:MAG: hypothetical protein BWY78_00936 [Alphaproteobacteria bacterium ADurb.Bin438]